jgi:MFS family permease
LLACRQIQQVVPAPRVVRNRCPRVVPSRRACHRAGRHRSRVLAFFYQLALPPLFPLLRAEFDVSWTLLGLLVGIFYGASALTQFGAGFVVDRMGARPVLLGGLGLLAGGTMVASLAPGGYWLFPIVALMGVGNGVFHPADFAIINANVAPRRLGYAYSMHGIGGTLGYALAPVVSYGLAMAFNWRISLACMGAAGLVAVGILATQRLYLNSQRAHDADTHTLRGSFALFAQTAILLCFGYFVDLGAMLGPIWFGLMLDQAMAREMFFVVAVGTVMRVRRAGTA